MSVIQYLEYHEQSYAAKDIDPAYPMLKYICDRFELNIEQRCWIAFLYGCTYCGPTVFYIYNEFPDFENPLIEIHTKSNKIVSCFIL